MRLLSNLSILVPGLGSSVIIAGAENDIIRVLPNGLVAPLLIACFTLIVFFLKQYYQAMLASMQKHSGRLDRIEVTLIDMDKQLAVLAERESR